MDSKNEQKKNFINNIICYFGCKMMKNAKQKKKQNFSSCVKKYVRNFCN